MRTLAILVAVLALSTSAVQTRRPLPTDSHGLPHLPKHTPSPLPDLRLQDIPFDSSPSLSSHDASFNPNISLSLFAELEEFSRIVDISYCVGTTGIQKPFSCLGRCSEFSGRGFELVETWNTGVLMTDSCGYVVVDHGIEKGKALGESTQKHFGLRDDKSDDKTLGTDDRTQDNKSKGRIIVAFRGTYSLANTIVDLSTIPQEYVPYPGDPDEEDPGAILGMPICATNANDRTWVQRIWNSLPPFLLPSTHSAAQAGEPLRVTKHKRPKGPKCTNCTVHSGFLTSYTSTRSVLLPTLKNLITAYPDYSLHLVGHSLGGAVACLAALEYEVLGWQPTITTFGEPRVGNTGFRGYVDSIFELGDMQSSGDGGRYRRVTHVDDPVPLLPLSEWSYRPHAGEVYISRPELPPLVSDIRHCDGDEDADCIEGADASLTESSDAFGTASEAMRKGGIEVLKELGGFDNPEMRKLLSMYNERALHYSEENYVDDEQALGKRSPWGLDLDARFKIWQLLFAHRDYFWRLGVCMPGGDPGNWGRHWSQEGQI